MNIQVWTGTDLHGAGSALVLKWLYKDAKAFNINDVSEYTFAGRFRGALQTLDHYDRVYIVDLDLSPEQIKLADRDNVVIIDTHKNHIKNKHLYSKAKTILEGYPDHGHQSTIDLIYNKCDGRLLDLTDEQLLLIEYIGAYDWYNTQYKESLKLNAIYYNLNSPKTENFISAFSKGFREFTIYEKNAVKLYFKKFKDQIESGQVFKGALQTLDHYDRVFIVDLDLTPEQIELADRDNVVVIDTHKNHIKNKHLYKKAKTILEGYPDHGHQSTIDLIYNKFGDH